MNTAGETRPPLPGGELGVLAIIRLRDHKPDDELLGALVDGGIRAVEVTLPTPGSLDAVRRWAADDRVVVGVGTVRTERDAVLAAEAGAQFIVTPTTVLDVLRVGAERSVPVVPGALTATEIDLAWHHGAAAVKVFPISAVGGPAYLRAVREPLDDVLVLPTGGVDPAAAQEYARAGCVGVGAGGRLVAEQVVADRDWAALTDRASEFVAGWEAGRRDR